MNFTFMRLGARLVKVSGVLPFIESLETHRRDLLRVLTYHRIGYPEAENGLLDPSLLSATPEQFKQQMRFLQEHYRLLSIHDILQAIETGEGLPPKSVLVTFDDGYQNFVDTAWPILERYQVPALMFLATGFLSPENQIYWWDRLYQGIFRTKNERLHLPPDFDLPITSMEHKKQVFTELKNQICCMDSHLAMQLVDRIMDNLEVIHESKGIIMNWSDARLLSQKGCSLAAHTRSHSILSRVSKEDTRLEISASRQDIYREIGIDLPVMAYPSGHAQDIGENLLPILQEEGFKLAMTSIPGINEISRCNLLQIKRLDLSPRLNPLEFQLILTGIYHFYCTSHNLCSSLRNWKR